MQTLSKLLGTIYSPAAFEQEIMKVRSHMDQEYPFDMRSEAYVNKLCVDYSHLNRTFLDLDETKHVITHYTKASAIGALHDTNGRLEWLRSNAISLLTHATSKVLCDTGALVQVKFDKLIEWDQLINQVAQDILMGAHGAKHPHVRFSETLVVPHDNTRLERILKQGYGDTHMHMQASGYANEINWYLFSTGSLLNTPSFSAIRKQEAIKMGTECPELCQLRDAKLKLLKAYFYNRIISSDFFETLGAASPIQNPYDDTLSLQDIFAYHHDFQLLSQLDYFQFTVDQMVQNVSRHHPGTFKYVAFERDFLKAVFQMINTGKLTSFEIYAFNVYLSGYNAFKFTFAQNHEIMGFEYFKRFENIKKSYIDDTMVDVLYKSVFDKYYREGAVRFIEFRIGPNGTLKLRDLFRRVERLHNEVFNELSALRKDLVRIRVAYVIHYIKSKDRVSHEGIQFRKQAFVESLMDTSQDIITAIESCGQDNPLDSQAQSESIIVGIDAANYELNCRPEMFATLYRAHVQAHCNQLRLGLTYHVGEGFMTIANGLRAIDEAILFLGLRRGDRLGHATALGLDITNYFKIKRNKIFTTLQDHLDDIAWMYRKIKNSRPHELEVIAYLKSTIDDLLCQLYDHTHQITASEYTQSLVLRGDYPEIYNEVKDDNVLSECDYAQFCFKHPAKLNSQIEDHQQVFSLKRLRQIYMLYHYDRESKKKGAEEKIYPCTDLYIRAVTLFQEILRKEVCNKGIIVEVNPSSNLKISPATTLDQIQLLTLNSRLLDHHKSQNHVMVSINTDDSSIFQTDLKNEYALIASQLHRETFEPEDIYAYINDLRDMTIMSTFIDM